MSKLVPKVIAQSEPTFPYDGPFEEPEPPPSTPSEAAVKLSTSTSSLQVGQTATCDLNIESGDEEVQSYSIKISFNSSILEVVDANLTQSGIQTNFLDTSFTIQTNSADNTMGTITLTTTASSASQTINKRIAQITFRAKRTGTSVVSIDKSQSSVNDIIGENIIGATTSLNFTVTGQTQTTPTPAPSPAPQLPASGLFDTLATFGSILSGVLMLYVGVKTVAGRKRDKHNDF